MNILRRIKYYLVRLFRIKSGSHQIALGVIIGFSPCWLPTFGIGPMLSVALAKFVKANVISALISAALGSFLWPLLFFLNYKMGSILMFNDVPEKRPSNTDDVTYIEPIEQVNSLRAVGIEFTIGAIFNIVFFGIVGYIALYYLFNRYRERILLKLLNKK
jgi:uncharacterized protein (DUF2062 family)